MQHGNSNNVHHLYTTCTPITKRIMCTLKRHLSGTYLYTYIKVFNKGSLLRFFTKVLNICTAKKNFRLEYGFLNCISIKTQASKVNK